jgi:hypothetical protein
MPFGNQPNDYPLPAEKGFGAQTADQSPFSTLCPLCLQNYVKEAACSENKFNEYFSETLFCTNCGWKSDPKPI